VAAVKRADAAVRLLYRPGQFVMQGATLAQVLPGARSGDLAPAIQRDIVIGRHRTLRQDLEFGIAQLVEIALRALSPAINDTFTGLTCVDWLADELRAWSKAALSRRAKRGGGHTSLTVPLTPRQKPMYLADRGEASSGPPMGIQLGRVTDPRATAWSTSTGTRKSSTAARQSRPGRRSTVSS